AFVHRSETSFEEQLFHKRIADLYVWPLCTGIFTKASRRHRRTVNAVASRLGANVDDGITDAVRAAVEDFVFFEDAKRERIHQRILGVGIGEVNLTANSRHAKAVAVKRDSTYHAFEDTFVLMF